MPRFKVVLLEHGYSTVRYEREIIAAAGGDFIDCDTIPLETALEECRDADGIMLRRITVSAEMIRGFARCKMLLRYGVGVDNIDLSAATSAGIMVGHVPIYCQDEVSTHAIALLLACVRRILPTSAKMRAGGWDVHRDDPVFRLAGKTVGLVGFGTLGQAVARKLGGWNLRLLAADPYIEREIVRRAGAELVPLDLLLRESDFVSLHLPLLPETRHLMAADTLARMKRGAILINTARGGLVSGAALLEALERGQLNAAALDVFEEEPLPADSALRSHPRLLVTDHMAWYSEESQIELQERAAREMARACTGGLPEHIANPEVLEPLGRAQEWTPTHLARWQAERGRRNVGILHPAAR
jgi:D-3-phosphoglycerate dehydrogenase / 2-oxoglutarate reductase